MPALPKRLKRIDLADMGRSVLRPYGCMSLSDLLGREGTLKRHPTLAERKA
jgi:hypothetical protein